ncbi:MAG: hypothetical protein ACP5FH_05605 [Terracidiphilus sp.]
MRGAHVKKTAENFHDNILSAGRLFFLKEIRFCRVLPEEAMHLVPMDFPAFGPGTRAAENAAECILSGAGDSLLNQAK